MNDCILLCYVPVLFYIWCFHRVYSEHGYAEFYWLTMNGYFSLMPLFLIYLACCKALKWCYERGQQASFREQRPQSDKNAALIPFSKWLLHTATKTHTNPPEINVSHNTVLKQVNVQNGQCLFNNQMSQCIECSWGKIAGVSLRRKLQKVWGNWLLSRSQCQKSAKSDCYH